MPRLPALSQHLEPALVLGAVAGLLAWHEAAALHQAAGRLTSGGMLAIVTAWAIALAITRRSTPWRRLRVCLLLAAATWLTLAAVSALAHGAGTSPDYSPGCGRPASAPVRGRTALGYFGTGAGTRAPVNNPG